MKIGGGNITAVFRCGRANIFISDRRSVWRAGSLCRCHRGCFADGGRAVERFQAVDEARQLLCLRDHRLAGDYACHRCARRSLHALFPGQRVVPADAVVRISGRCQPAIGPQMLVDGFGVWNVHVGQRLAHYATARSPAQPLSIAAGNNGPRKRAVMKFA